MRVIRIFQTGPFVPGETIELSPEAGLHVGVVLRMQVGMALTLFCGDNQEYQANIIEVHKKRVLVKIIKGESSNRESPRDIHLAQSISKGDRMEWVIQKAVELGVKSITPIITARCTVKLDEARRAKKHQQWQGIIISACEQSGRNAIPILNPSMNFAGYIKHCTASLKLILSPNAKHSWRDIHIEQGDIELLIGPEGGLTEDEMLEAKKNQFTALTLGPRILRTETAAIAALSLLQAVSGDL